MLTRSKTTTALLEGLLESHNDELWAEFDLRYRPVLLGLARRFGLRLADAEDVAQEALIRFMKNYRAGKYDRQRGRLRSWLVAIARNCILDTLRLRAARREWRGQSAIVELPEVGELEAIWDTECRQAIVRRALRELRDQTRSDPQTVRAFELVVFEQRKPADVARELGMSVDSVYAAKSRCTKHLRSIVAQLNEAYEIESAGR